MIKEMDNKDLESVLLSLKKNDITELLEVCDESNYLNIAFDCYEKSQSNDAYTATLNNVPVCVFGIKQINPHTGHVWCFSTDDLSKVVIGVIKKLKQMIKSSNYGRITTTSPVYRPESHRVINLIGLFEEGRMKRAGKSGSDFISFVNEVNHV